DRRYRGRVAEVRPRVDRAKATVTVKVAFVDEPRDVLPDMGAKVTFLTKELDAAQAKAAPVAAVQSDAVVEQGENKVVWVVGGNDEVRIAPVVTGVAMGGLVALRQGPPAGTKVVRRPNGDLRPGMRVKEKQ
ncbi:MAG: efflux RND transporter periplasmic adaptor subunit, partial [Myxococcales bacterium]